MWAALTSTTLQVRLHPHHRLLPQQLRLRQRPRRHRRLRLPRPGLRPQDPRIHQQQPQTRLGHRLPAVQRGHLRGGPLLRHGRKILHHPPGKIPPARRRVEDDAGVPALRGAAPPGREPAGREAGGFPVHGGLREQGGDAGGGGEGQAAPGAGGQGWVEGGAGGAAVDAGGGGVPGEAGLQGGGDAIEPLRLLCRSGVHHLDENSKKAKATTR